MSTRRHSGGRGEGEARGRTRGEQASGGKSGNDLLEPGQLRGVDEDELVASGMHGGPRGHGHHPSKSTPGKGRSR